MGTTGTTTSPRSDLFPAEIHRPRNRPRFDFKNKRRARAETVETESIPGEPTSRGWVGRLRDAARSNSVVAEGVMSPHLHRDRRTTGVLPTWVTPSMDSFKGQKMFSPLTRQMWLFCLGFIFPIAWFLAAVLPLPPKPVLYDPEAQEDSGPNGRIRPSELADMEREEKYYLKAHWWRMLNRLMCFAGVAVIGAVITLAILATRAHA
jgi:hypothetical protein